MDCAQKYEPMDADDLRDADVQILNELRKGRATKGMLVDSTGFSRNTVYNRLEVLKAAGHIDVVHEGTRLFELVDDPRTDAESEPDIDALKQHVNELEKNLADAREEIKYYKDVLQSHKD
ncbi:helix-turn-helix transcriptional regulator [Natrinema gelatinilyticum]|uniref:helix-turn-helix transcriptional regulator n=1 Tax=Natrinema gelatinilyticum TaxID=2961571 RepID=UPI0020C48BDE|nr:winged helix-turn-helix domain-containing protein [Natrinema gelatinilyticum]